MSRWGFLGRPTAEEPPTQDESFDTGTVFLSRRELKDLNADLDQLDHALEVFGDDSTVISEPEDKENETLETSELPLVKTYLPEKSSRNLAETPFQITEANVNESDDNRSIREDDNRDEHDSSTQVVEPPTEASHPQQVVKPTKPAPILGDDNSIEPVFTEDNSLDSFIIHPPPVQAYFNQASNQKPDDDDDVSTREQEAYPEAPYEGAKDKAVGVQDQWLQMPLPSSDSTYFSCSLRSVPSSELSEDGELETSVESDLYEGHDTCTEVNEESMESKQEDEHCSQQESHGDKKGDQNVECVLQSSPHQNKSLEEIVTGAAQQNEPRAETVQLETETDNPTLDVSENDKYQSNSVSRVIEDSHSIQGSGENTNGLTLQLDLLIIDDAHDDSSDLYDWAYSLWKQKGLLRCKPRTPRDYRRHSLPANVTIEDKSLVTPNGSNEARLFFSDSKKERKSSLIQETSDHKKTVREMSKKEKQDFSNILQQWKEKSNNNANHDILSPENSFIGQTPVQSARKPLQSMSPVLPPFRFNHHESGTDEAADKEKKVISPLIPSSEKTERKRLSLSVPRVRSPKRYTKLDDDMYSVSSFTSQAGKLKEYYNKSVSESLERTNSPILRQFENAQEFQTDGKESPSSVKSQPTVAFHHSRAKVMQQTPPRSKSDFRSIVQTVLCLPANTSRNMGNDLVERTASVEEIRKDNGQQEWPDIRERMTELSMLPKPHTTPRQYASDFILEPRSRGVNIVRPISQTLPASSFTSNMSKGTLAFPDENTERNDHGEKREHFVDTRGVNDNRIYDENPSNRRTSIRSSSRFIGKYGSPNTEHNAQPYIGKTSICGTNASSQLPNAIIKGVYEDIVTRTESPVLPSSVPKMVTVYPFDLCSPFDEFKDFGAIKSPEITTRSAATRTPILECRCSESIFSGNNDLVDFFLPLMGMACKCGKQGKGFVNYKVPTSLENILRPWQVQFLASFGIYRGEELVKAQHRSAMTLATALRQYRRKNGMTPYRTKSCAMALQIWSKCCKAFVRSIRKQRASGRYSLKMPNTLPLLSSFIEQMSPSNPSSTSASNIIMI